MHVSFGTVEDILKHTYMRLGRNSLFFLLEALRNGAKLLASSFFLSARRIQKQRPLNLIYGNPIATNIRGYVGAQRRLSHQLLRNLIRLLAFDTVNSAPVLVRYRTAYVNQIKVNQLEIIQGGG